MTIQYTWLCFLKEDTVHPIKNNKKSHYTLTFDYSKIFAFVAVYNNTGHGLFDIKVVQF